MRVPSMLHAVRLWYWRRKYRPGKAISQFIARDVRRDVTVMDVSRIEEGIIAARTRTWNVLYHAHEVQERPGFGEVREIELNRLWEWPGESWDGPVPPSIDRPIE